MFKLRPYGGALLAAFFTVIVGGLLSTYFFMEDAYQTGVCRGYFTLIVTVVLTILEVGVAFSRYSFGHLKHHRQGYKRG
jgi:hypothetical protein